uniref:peroxidase n=1 Tax=Glycine max TaxID=3847 RepID=A0A0R0HBY6_SOYBN
MTSEKLAGLNLNSLRGFEVIDKIKFLLEEECPITVSCADILAMAARDAVELRGGPRWEVLLGRKDSLESSFEVFIDNFKQQDLDIEDLVTLLVIMYLNLAVLICPVEGRDNKFAPLDFQTTKRFDNHYFTNILKEGLVRAYASNEKLFFASFAKSMIKMGNINVLTGSEGEIRRNCRFVNA